MGRRALVLVNYGSHDLLSVNLGPACLEQAHPPEVVVVDNFKSVADSAAMAALAAERGWHLLTSPRNDGFGTAANRGIRAAAELGCRTVTVVNPDLELPRAAIDVLHAAALADPRALLTPVIVRPDGRVWFEGGWIARRGGGLRRAADGPAAGLEPWLTGACLTAHIDLWTELGGFSDDYFLYWEDVDLSERCTRAGGSLVVRSDLRVVHDAGGTQTTAGQRVKSPVYYRYNCRNRLLFAARNLSRPEMLRWVATTPRDMWSVLLRGGRRQFRHPTRNLLPALAGSVAGLRFVCAALVRGPAGARPPRRARFYNSLRSAHLERAAATTPAVIYFGRRRDDFDASLTAGLDLVEVSNPVLAAARMTGAGVDTVEINEPLMMPGLGRTAAVVVTLRVLGAAIGRRPRLVAYAIENRDPFAARPAGLRPAVRRRIDGVLSRLVAGQLDRLAFGTAAAQELYAGLLPGHPATRTTLVTAVPAACGCGPVAEHAARVLFVGALEDRKGFPALASAWPSVVAAVPGAELVVIGTGPHLPLAETLAAGSARVRLLVDPPRDVVHEQLRAASVLVLFSQPTHRWREQVGLPIVEGLAHGCAVVTSGETGLAGWLADHGHRVLRAGSTDDELAGAVISAIVEARPAAKILTDLPDRDGRLAADDWLFAGDAR